MSQRQRWWVIKATDGEIGSFGSVPSGLLLRCMSIAIKEMLEMMHHLGVPVICTPVSEICAQRYCTIYIA